MIKFFRKIRYDLMEENKTGKYLKYAIGEILLVVVGILIAIQLNNFNENSQKEKNGVQILIKLKEEIDQDIVYFISLIGEYNVWNSQTKYLLDSVLNGKVTRLERLEQYNIGRGSMNVLHINKSSYNELLNSGNIIAINNRELKNSIVSFFHEAEIELNKLNIDNERFNLWLYDNSDPILWHRLWEKRNLNYEDWSWLQDPSSDKFRTFEGRVLFNKNAIQASILAINAIRSSFQTMSEIIEKELEK